MRIISIHYTICIMHLTWVIYIYNIFANMYKYKYKYLLVMLIYFIQKVEMYSYCPIIVAQNLYNILGA